jgi:ATP-dependent helicase/nuclease subunit B
MDWNQPGLNSAVDYLINRYLDRAADRLDLDGVLVVVPGSRAGRRLSQLLSRKAAELEVALFLPIIQTVGHLPEHLYHPKRPFASELVQQLAWIEAIQKEKSRAKKYFPNLPDSRETLDWMELAAMLSKVHRELAADGLDFQDVANHGISLKGFSDTRRWKFLSLLQQNYLEILDELSLWDLQTARLFAIRNRECQSDREILLLATVDLNRATRQILDQVSGQVIALIQAPESESLGFDEYGCLIPGYWKDRKIEIPDEHILVTDQPEDQADAVLHLVDQTGGRYSADELVVGVPAAEVAPYLQRKFAGLGISTNWAVGRPIRETSPFKLLEAIAAIVENDRYADIASLVRHPDVESWLNHGAIQKVNPDEVIGECDSYYRDHLVPTFGFWLEKSNRRPNLHWAVEQITQLISPIRKKQDCLTCWVKPLMELVAKIYSGFELELDNPSHAGHIAALSEIRTTLESFLDVPEQLDIRTSSVNVIRLLLQKMGQKHANPAADRNGIDLLGWLELPLDLSPAAIVTHFNEGSIPESQNSDMFLPNRLRSTLELTDNERRYARDAYVLSTLNYSRDYLRLIVGKRNQSGDPLKPSRLFFATDRESIARRVIQFTQPMTFFESGSAGQKTESQSEFYVPAPMTEGIQIESISVTSFRTFLKCPYRFYLQHVLRLDSINDEDRELNGMVFGNILHDVFRKFGEHRLRFSEEPDEINLFLEDELNSIVQRDYGKRRLPAVEIQIQQMRHRLRGFAEWQAERTRLGWEIQFVEKKSQHPRGVPFEYGGSEPAYLKGKIDRVDYHPKRDQWQILDYKTGDSGENPARKHKEKGAWIDLQLPLYKHIAKEFEVSGNVQMGYIVVPKDTEKITESIAKWSDEELEEAFEVARDCCRRIFNLEFWKPTHPAPRSVGSEFSAICQDEVFEPRLATQYDNRGQEGESHESA